MSIRENLEEEVVDVRWQNRAQTILQTVGILAFGFMLGVHYMTIVAREEAPTLAYTNTEASIQQPYTEAMLFGMVVAGVALCAAILLELRYRE